MTSNLLRALPSATPLSPAGVRGRASHPVPGPRWRDRGHQRHLHPLEDPQVMASASPGAGRAGCGAGRLWRGQAVGQLGLFLSTWEPSQTLSQNVLPSGTRDHRATALNTRDQGWCTPQKPFRNSHRDGLCPALRRQAQREQAGEHRGSSLRR